MDMEAGRPQGSASPSPRPAVPPTTQDSPARVTEDVLDAIEARAARDWSDMKERIQGQTDPVEHAQQRLQDVAVRALNASSQCEDPCAKETFIGRLQGASPEEREAFFSRPGLRHAKHCKNVTFIGALNK